MIKINVTGFLTEFTEGRRQIQLDGGAMTVCEALTELWRLHPGVRDRVLNEQGQVRRHINVFLNDENIRRQQAMETPLNESDEITILPSVSGG